MGFSGMFIGVDETKYLQLGHSQLDHCRSYDHDARNGNDFDPRRSSWRVKDAQRALRWLCVAVLGQFLSLSMLYLHCPFMESISLYTDYK